MSSVLSGFLVTIPGRMYGNLKRRKKVDAVRNMGLCIFKRQKKIDVLKKMGMCMLLKNLKLYAEQMQTWKFTTTLKWYIYNNIWKIVWANYLELSFFQDTTTIKTIWVQPIKIEVQDGLILYSLLVRSINEINMIYLKYKAPINLR